MKILTTLSLFALTSAAASAQWSTDPSANFPVSDAVGDQVQPKIAPTADGGCYISWFDNIANGFDVRLQRLDVDGYEMWAHDGILVFDRGFSWTQDYGLDVDAAGNALLAFRDDSGTYEQITAMQVSPAGVLNWGASGVQVSNTTGMVAAPKIAGTSDGGAVVAWTEDSNVKLQKLDAAGAAQWAPAVTMVPSVGTNSVADLHDSGTDVILSIVHVNGPYFYSPKHLEAQKLDASGAFLWGSTPIAVYDGGSLQFGNYPPFTPDGLGGALFAWYGVSPLQCYAQHILFDGTEAYPHNGVEGSTNLVRVRVSPSITYEPSTGSSYMFWEEQNSLQSNFALWGQKFDPNGARQWTTEGISFTPISSDEIRQVKVIGNDDGTFVFWTHIPSIDTDTLQGAHVDSTGTFDAGPFDVSSWPSGKSRLDAEMGATGQVILAWSDQRADGGDILAQNVEPQGSVEWYCGSGVNVPTDGFTILNTPSLGGTLMASVVQGHPSNTGAILFGYSSAVTLSLTWGEVLVNPLDPAGELLGLPVAYGNPAGFGLPVPVSPILFGFRCYIQAVGFGGGVYTLHCAYACYVGL